MKTSETRAVRRAAFGAMLAVALWSGAAFAGDAANFKPGTYTGTLQLVHTIDSKVFNKSTVKVRGHTTSASRIILLAPPQQTMPIVLQTADDHPVRYYAIEFSTSDQAMELEEFGSMDSGGGFGGAFFSSLVVKPASVTATIDLPDRFVKSFEGSNMVSQKLIIKLVRTGP
jgi:hypothetical protein